METNLTFAVQVGLNRRVGGLLSLSYPLALTALSLSVGFRGSAESSEIATSVLSAVVFIVAAPTSWVFAIDFIEASRMTVISVGVLTSFPLWFLAGFRLAVVTNIWSQWVWRYASICGLWTTTVFFLLFGLAKLSG